MKRSNSFSRILPIALLLSGILLAAVRGQNGLMMVLVALPLVAWLVALSSKNRASNPALWTWVARILLTLPVFSIVFMIYFATQHLGTGILGVSFLVVSYGLFAAFNPSLLSRLIADAAMKK
jgi:drug/metabolite transporter (DMT)-like permease